MKRLALKISLVVFAGIFLFSCEKIPSGGNGTQSTDIEVSSDLVSAGNAFAMKLFATAYAQSPDDENMVLSPLSLNMALAMVWNGANGETKTAIQTAMGMENFSTQEVNNYFQTLRTGLATIDASNTQLALANSIWYHPKFTVKQEFINLNQLYYNALVQQLDFQQPGATDILNQWCSDNTNGLIKDMFSPPLSPTLVMMLINALYFKSVWADSFAFAPESTENASFYQSDNQEITVNMMQQRNDFQYYADNNLQLLTIPYGNGAFTMNFVLPNTSFSDLMTALQQPNYWANCLNNRHIEKYFKINIPKFKVEYDSKESLKPILTNLGMGIAFTECSDFSGISNTQTYISKVRQKAYIDVNEQGTEAAAVTAIGIGTTSIQPEFTLNRPFLFVIREESTGAVLFMGRINKPVYEN